ncbi:hypothetical protein LNQ03_06110 [Klebsiella pneumoniae subsp. pneumoniae]|nr:hypothetical protein [Klebsiella pneumoniae subsp. pneumoniae]
MEAALRENRMTLEAIRVTQSDRDLFKTPDQRSHQLRGGGLYASRQREAHSPG